MGDSRNFQAHLRIEGLAVARGATTLFRDLSFAAAPGALVELRGPNGVGKTTLLRALAGFLRPQAGRIAFDGVAERELALHVLGHRDGLKPGLTARAHARFWAGLLGGEPARVEAVLTRVGLGRIADLPARALSQGQGRRLSLSRLLIAPRPVWLLDEPAAGLDANGKTLLAALIEEQCAAGGVVIAAVHEALGPTPAQTLTLAETRS